MFGNCFFFVYPLSWGFWDASLVKWKSWEKVFQNKNIVNQLCGNVSWMVDSWLSTWKYWHLLQPSFPEMRIYSFYLDLVLQQHWLPATMALQHSLEYSDSYRHCHVFFMSWFHNLGHNVDWIVPSWSFKIIFWEYCT